MLSDESPEGWLITPLEIYDQGTIISRSEFILVIHILFIYALLLSVELVIAPPSGGKDCGD